MKIKPPRERSIRLATGVVLFTYAGCHFLSHATGVFRLELMEAFGRGVILAPWRTWPGLTLLFGSLIVHGCLGLLALIRRRHLRMPAVEAWQLGLGLLIPLLLIPHASNVRLGSAVYALDDSYYRLVYQYWISQPAVGLTRQFFLLLAVWVHGCIGLHTILRLKPWYRDVLPVLAGLAICIPFLAILGISQAGSDAVLHSALDRGFATRYGPPPAGTADADQRAVLETTWNELCVWYVLLIAGVLAFRWLRNVRAARSQGVRISYPGRPPVVVPKGFSVLEASRWAGIPHTSICGGRGRCSTCRIRITSGRGAPPPNRAERATLDMVRAPNEVRLACQFRPLQDVGVLPLIPAQPRTRGLRIDVDDGRELTVTALCTDLRDSTGLAAGKLPFDTIYIVDRYVECVTGAIRRHGGYVTSVAGDGIMSVFGVDGDAPGGARGAFAAAAAVWDGLARLGQELADDLKAPLRFGIGMHTGVAVVGPLAAMGIPSLQFLGDTGNVAARLDELSKELGATFVVSDSSFIVAGVTPAPNLESTEFVARGRGGAPLRAFLVRDKADVAAISASRQPAMANKRV